MSETTLPANVLLTLTCGNSKCAHVITKQVVSSESAAHLQHTMATQQMECSKCHKVGRNHVTSAVTDAPLTGGDATRQNKPTGADMPRRHRGTVRKQSTPPERGQRRRGARSRGKVGPPPMSQRQIEKLQRRGEADAILGPAKVTAQPERQRQIPPSGAIPQPTVAQPKPPRTPRPALPPATSRAGRSGRAEAPAEAPEAPPATPQPPVAPAPAGVAPGWGAPAVAPSSPPEPPPAPPAAAQPPVDGAPPTPDTPSS